MSILFSELLASLRPIVGTATDQQGHEKNSEQWSINIDDSWMQGRTTYGGLSAALCLKAVENRFPDLPTLRSAQINFIGPAGGEVTITTKIMRQGRSVSYISAQMIGEKGLATHAILCFGAPRESKLDETFTKAPKVPSYKNSKPFFRTQVGPKFSRNFECLLAQGGHPISGSDQHEHFIWARHNDRNASDMAALVGIADMPPPAVLPMFKEQAPISSMTWMFDCIQTAPRTIDGWWLLRSAADHARDGYASQDMQIWNTSGELVLSGRQNIAIFY